MTPAALRIAAAVGAAVVALSSAGNAFVVAALLGVAGGGACGLAAALAVAATVARFGAADLGAVAGAQSVLGPAVAMGPAAGAAASALAGAAVVLAARFPDGGAGRLRWLVPVAAGALAGALAAGPSGVRTADLLTRLGALAAGIVLAGVVAAVRAARPAVDRVLLPGAVVVGVAALVVGVLA